MPLIVYYFGITVVFKEVNLKYLISHWNRGTSGEASWTVVHDSYIFFQVIIPYFTLSFMHTPRLVPTCLSPWHQKIWKATLEFWICSHFVGSMSFCWFALPCLTEKEFGKLVIKLSLNPSSSLLGTFRIPVKSFIFHLIEIFNSRFEIYVYHQ